MKRKNEDDALMRRTSRSVTRKIADEKRVLDAAEQFAQSPVLRGLSLVLTSGFLYRKDCDQTSLACKSWSSVWKQEKKNLPAYAYVEITYQFDLDPPNYMKSYEFCRAVFDKVAALQKQVRPSAEPFVWEKDDKCVKIRTRFPTLYDMEICHPYEKLIVCLHPKEDGVHILSIHTFTTFGLIKECWIRRILKKRDPSDGILVWPLSTQ